MARRATRSQALKWLQDQSAAYAIFETEAGQRVLADLIEWSGWGMPGSIPDDNEAKARRMIGRQEVAMRILDFAKLDSAILAEKYLADGVAPSASDGNAEE